MPSKGRVPRIRQCKFPLAHHKSECYIWHLYATNPQGLVAPRQTTNQPHKRKNPELFPVRARRTEVRCSSSSSGDRRKQRAFIPHHMRRRQTRERIAQRASVSTPAQTGSSETPTADHPGTAWLDASAKHRARQRELKELFHADHYVPAEPVAEWLAVGIPGLRLLIAKGLPCHRLSPRVTRFRKSEIAAWVQSRP